MEIWLECREETDLLHLHMNQLTIDNSTIRFHEAGEEEDDAVTGESDGAGWGRERGGAGWGQGRGRGGVGPGKR